MRFRRVAPACIRLAGVLIGVLALGTTHPAAAQDAAVEAYDLVVANGRVMDPESGLDAVLNVGVSGGKIRAISQEPLSGRRTIDARGLVVAPGFIDLHQHGQTPEDDRYKVTDGVTTSLELEIGTGDVARWYAGREGKALVHYGVSIGHIPVRMLAMDDPGGLFPVGDAAHRAATEAEVEEMKRRIEEGLEQGAVAVGVGIAYTEAATRWELLEMFRVAARYGASSHVHLRHDAERVQSLGEVIAASALTGAPVHAVHLQSTGGKEVPRLLQMVHEAQARGLDVTTESYPYAAGMTLIESAIYDRVEDRPDSFFSTMQWPGVSERLNRESFAKYRQQGGWVIQHSNTEEIVRAALVSPLTMVASDGIPYANGLSHPRSAGTYARVLGRYVREEQALGLMEALRKMTIMPARRLEGRVPAMRDKGRIRVGADADLTIFDPEQIIDRATYEAPARYSEGILYVLVGGVPVVEAGRLREDVRPGRAVRAPILRGSRVIP